MTDMTNFNIALHCEYAAHDFRAAHTFALAKEMCGANETTDFVTDSRVNFAVENFQKAAALLGYHLVRLETTPAEPQDIDKDAPGYSAGLSGRVA
jgi:hypothetical protein